MFTCSFSRVIPHFQNSISPEIPARYYYQ